MTANTAYKYSGTLLGSFEFTGTRAEYEILLRELREVSPEFTGVLTDGYTKDTLPDQGRGVWRECLNYDGECIAIAI